MAKYNDFENDDYLLTTNMICAVTSEDLLEKLLLDTLKSIDYMPANFQLGKFVYLYYV